MAGWRKNSMSIIFGQNGSSSKPTEIRPPLLPCNSTPFIINWTIFYSCLSRIAHTLSMLVFTAAPHLRLTAIIRTREVDELRKHTVKRLRETVSEPVEKCDSSWPSSFFLYGWFSAPHLLHWSRARRNEFLSCIRSDTDCPEMSLWMRIRLPVALFKRPWNRGWRTR